MVGCYELLILLVQTDLVCERLVQEISGRKRHDRRTIIYEQCASSVQFSLVPFGFLLRGIVAPVVQLAASKTF